MRRGTMLGVMIAAILMIGASVAYAATFRCDGGRCFGTQQADRFFESDGDDFIVGMGQNDVVNAAEFDDDEDDVRGEGGNDRIRTDDGDTEDSVNCGAGNKDIAVVDSDASEESSDTVKANCEDVRTNLDTTAVPSFADASVKQIIANSDPVE